MKRISYLNGILPFCPLDDDEFSLALFELINGTVHFTEDRLFTLLFNSLLSEKDRSLALSSDLHSDLNFFYDSNESDYYTEDQSNDRFFIKMPSIQCLSFLHLNIRNLSRNIDSLTNVMNEIKAKFSLIGISETWLQDISHTLQ